MNKKPHEHSKPFNLEHAKSGAPVGLSDGSPMRIVCWDIIGYGREYILVLVKLYDNHEYASNFNLDGTDRVNGSTSLVMLPYFMLYGIPVYYGDTIQGQNGTMDWFDIVIGGNFEFQPHFKYRWPKAKPVMFKGREITPDSLIWYKGHTNTGITISSRSYRSK